MLRFDNNGMFEVNSICDYDYLILGESVSIETSQCKYYYLFDGLGSVTGLTDTGGNLVATYGYDAFGNIVSETGDATL
ncbi:MAG: RHS repeat protein, partial [Candidatus Thermoplasmatota archaeon]|nr:RHS repeat protein [Candidatus Thermoplasmatota archaeon]